MTTLSTHDTKRGEDVRARLAVLAELPDEWADAVGRWTAGAPLPDPAFADLLWQTVVGAWPIDRERLHAYVEKAAREAARRDQLGRPGRATSRRRCTRWSTGSTTTLSCDGEVDRVRRPRSPRPAGATRSARSWCS